MRKSGSDTIGTVVATTSGHTIGKISFLGVDNSPAFDTGARITAIQDGAAGNYVPTNLKLETWGAAKNTDQLVLHNDGSVSMSGAFLPTNIAGNTLLVGPGMTYTTIDAALNAVSSGDTILVTEGTYDEDITYDDDNITIRSLGGKETTIITQAAAVVVTLLNKSGCTLEGFTINVTNADAPTDYCLLADNNHATTYNHVIDCDLNWTSTTVQTLHRAVNVADGNWEFRNCNFTLTASYSGGDVNSGNGVVYFVTAAGTSEFVNCKFKYTNAGTGACYGAGIRGNTITVRGCEFDIDVAGSGGIVRGIRQDVVAGVINVYNSKFVIDGSAANTLIGLNASITGGVINSYDNIFDVTSVGGNNYWSQTVSGAVVNSYHDKVLDGTVNDAVVGATTCYGTVDKDGILLQNTSNAFSEAAGTAPKLQVDGGGVSNRVIEDTDSDNTDVLSTGITSGYGMLIVSCTTDGISGIFRIENQTIVNVSSNALFTITKDNAATYNVYFDTGEYRVQNNVGDNKNITVAYFGT